MEDRNKILKRIKDAVLLIEPDAEIYLFVSRAKGAAHNDSDWDLLILLKENIIPRDLELKILSSLFDLEFGEIINPIIYSAHDWKTRRKITPFYKNVMSDRVIV